MPDLVILQRDDRDNGTTHLWVSCEGERSRFSIMTATLNGPDGHNIATLMACKAASDIKAARERGKLRLDS